MKRRRQIYQFGDFVTPRGALLLAVWMLGSTLTGAAQERPQPTNILDGHVLAADTGTPLIGAHVFIAGSTLGTATDADGYFRLSDVPLGSHRLYVSMLGFAPRHRDVVVQRDSTYAFTFRLDPRVLSMDGVTVTGVAGTRRTWPSSSSTREAIPSCGNPKRLAWRTRLRSRLSSA